MNSSVARDEPTSQVEIDGSHFSSDHDGSSDASAGHCPAISPSNPSDEAMQDAGLSEFYNFDHDAANSNATDNHDNNTVRNE